MVLCTSSSCRKLLSNNKFGTMTHQESELYKYLTVTKGWNKSLERRKSDNAYH